MKGIINLNEVCNFFNYHRRKTMPRVVLESVLSSNTIRYNNLKTGVLEWHNLRDIYSKRIANKIYVAPEGADIPFLRRNKSPIYYVYHPESGKYLGKFDIRKSLK